MDHEVFIETVVAEVIWKALLTDLSCLRQTLRLSTQLLAITHIFSFYKLKYLLRNYLISYFS